MHANQTPDDLLQDTAYIIHPELKSQETDEVGQSLAIEETEGLARAINLDVLKTNILNVAKIIPATFIGKGQAKMAGEEIKELKPDVVIVNETLSPVQQRNLEKIFEAKVIDRTGLILEIFGARAQTKEGTLQVELASLEYQRSRLVRSWTHLERQRGATGFIGGPGETQIEIDRRLIGERITKLKKELEDVRRTRDLGRKSRARIPLPVISLVGYTNAGKSTLFNKLTGANVFAEDLPFATLDPTTRRLELPNGQKIVFSDTVGFITDLPTHLIAAFRATLEQAIYSDVIVHVIDVSRKNWKSQRQDVIKILEELGIEYENDERILEVYNKIDALDEDDKNDLARDVKFSDNKAMISALSGEGREGFLDLLTETVAKEREPEHFSIPAADGKAISWLYDHGEVLEQTTKGKTIELKVMIHPINVERFVQQFSHTPDGYEPKDNT